MKIKCYMCSETIDVSHPEEYKTVQVYNDKILGCNIPYVCSISDDEIIAYICKDCYTKMKNIIKGEIR